MQMEMSISIYMLELSQWSWDVLYERVLEALFTRVLDGLSTGKGREETEKEQSGLGKLGKRSIEAEG